MGGCVCSDKMCDVNDEVGQTLEHHNWWRAFEEELFVIHQAQAQTLAVRLFDIHIALVFKRALNKRVNLYKHAIGNAGEEVVLDVTMHKRIAAHANQEPIWF